ncbi:MAG TPA: alanine--tRNA ligase [Candidatus Nanoarchaeia archaeon]|nr:alanine--tRNA ligase [Candidatus Nanoarchaeia archaeon]
MTAQELRAKYFNFFQAKGHKLISSASLLPENDPTVLFTTAGMQPLVPYLLGESHPEGKRLVDAQKCVRTDDIDEVGDTTHHTFFEMLGNWSLGDYFKKEAIEWSWEFLTSPQWLGLDKNRLACSVFAGDADAPFDEEAFGIWKKLGMNEKRIAKLPKKNNWWGPAGITGPCGPCSEMFYWAGDADKVPESFNDDNALWVEIWNDVFMQYNKEADGSFVPLKQNNVDTGMGLERALAALNGLVDNYLTDVWAGLIKKIEELSGKKYGESPEVTRSMRIIADHLKAATFIIGDEKAVAPSNTGAGYIVRRLIRRAVVFGYKLGIKKQSAFWLLEMATVVIEKYKFQYPELGNNANYVLQNILNEGNKFEKTLENGLKEFDKWYQGPVTYWVAKTTEKKAQKMIEKEPKKMPGFVAFNLFTTYGFPIEIIREIAKEKGIIVQEEEFVEEFKKHQELSRTASAGMFKGGLADASEATKKLHTAAHLLLAALRKVLGDHVYQRGSNITAERLRFDFSHPAKMTPEQIVEVERLVNEAIKKDLPIICEEKPLAQAKAEGAMGVFESKYGEKVKVYKMGEGELVVSQEICGGPHATRTGELGHFKIVKEESSSSGVRRIKAILT